MRGLIFDAACLGREAQQDKRSHHHHPPLGPYYSPRISSTRHLRAATCYPRVSSTRDLRVATCYPGVSSTRDLRKHKGQKKNTAAPGTKAPLSENWAHMSYSPLCTWPPGLGGDCGGRSSQALSSGGPSKTPLKTLRKRPVWTTFGPPGAPGAFVRGVATGVRDLGAP